MFIVSKVLLDETQGLGGLSPMEPLLFRDLASARAAANGLVRDFVEAHPGASSWSRDALGLSQVAASGECRLFAMVDVTEAAPQGVSDA